MSFVVSVGLLIECILATVAGGYVRHIAGQPEFSDPPPYLRLLFRICQVATAAGLVTGLIIVYSLLRFAVPELGLGPLPPPYGALAIGGAIAVLLSVVILIGWQFYKDRHPG